MSSINRVLITFAIVVIAHGCSVTAEQDKISGARPEIIFDGVDGIYAPARGIDRGGPDLVDGLPYRASGPFPISMRDVPRSDQAVDPIGQIQLRGGGRMEAPLPDHVMDMLREEALLLPPSSAIEDPTAVGFVAADAVPGAGFDSLDYTECCGGGGNVPPDPELAASNTHLIAVVNVAFEIYDTNGNSQVGPSTFASFFGGVPNCSGVFDPNVNYDEDADRFVMGIDANGSHYCIAVSETNDPTGNWFRFSFSTAGGRDFFDYPHLGVGDDAIYMGANMFGVRRFKEGRIWAIDKNDMYAGIAPTIVTYSTGTESTPQPMNARGALQGTWPAGGPQYILTDGQSFDGRNYGVWSWSNPFGGGSPIKEGEVDLNAATGQTAGSPVDQPQLGGGTIQANDWRGQDAEYRDGYIWMSNAQACNPGGGTVNCARWAQIDPIGPSVAAAGVVGSPGEYRSFPDLAVDACGNMMLGYSKTSSSMYPAVYAIGRDNAGLFGTEVEVKAGEITYTSFESSAPRRWGDYTEMTIAPDGSTFWYLGEYSKDTGTTNGRWGTYIGQFSFGCDGGGNLPPTAAITTPPDCTLLSCSFDGSGSTDDGTIVSYAWNFGDGNNGSGVAPPTHEYAAEGTYNVSLTVTDDLGATDTDNYPLTVDDGNNNLPTASFTYSCTNLACDFTDASTDSDGTVTGWDWGFGDGSTSSIQNPSHTYAAAGTYTVALTATDDAGDSDSASQNVTVSESSGITLSATGYKVRGLQKADLSWNDASGANVDVYRDGVVITTTANDGFYTDNIDVRGGNSYDYKVCEAGTAICSNTATVVF